MKVERERGNAMLNLNRGPLRKKLSHILFCLLFLSVGIFGMAALADSKKPPAEAKIEERVLQVEAIRARPVDVPVVITGYGEVRPLRAVAVSPEVSGTVIEVHPRLDSGEIIPGGEALFRIDTRNYDAAMKEARATVMQWENTIKRLEKQYASDRQRLHTLQRNRELAQLEFNRLRKLYRKDKVGTRSGVEKAEQACNVATDQVDQMNQALALYPIQIKEVMGSLASAQARLSVAAANLERCTVAVEFDARVKSVSIEQGQYVAPGQHVLTLADDAMLEIHVPLDSRDARQWLKFSGSRKHRGTAWFAGLEPVTCSIRWTEAGDNPACRGQLHRVVRFDRHTRTLTVAVRIDSAKAVQGLPLVEGMFCAVDIPGKTLKNVYRLPSWAVSYENTVYQIRESRLKTVSVEMVRVEGDTAIVAAGLQPGDLVVTTRLSDPLENIRLEITDVNRPRGSS
jgi:multidrug efflux pump subunit AcrA (membrane-fusion protein)